MDKKKRLWIIIGSVVVAVLLCVVLVCLIAGGSENGGSGIFSGFNGGADVDGTGAAKDSGADSADTTGNTESDDADTDNTIDEQPPFTVGIDVDTDDEPENTDSDGEIVGAIDFDDLLEKANGGD